VWWACGAAVLGVSQAPKNAPWPYGGGQHQGRPSYSQVLTEKTPRAQTDYLVWQAPDRLGGYIQSGSKRTYVYVLPSATGPVEYQSITQSVSGSTKHLIFYRQPGERGRIPRPDAELPPLRQRRPKNVTQSGDTYTFTLTQTTSHGNTETGTFVYTVTGPYVSQFNLTVETSSVQLVISGRVVTPGQPPAGGQGGPLPGCPPRCQGRRVPTALLPGPTGLLPGRRPWRVRPRHR
jgi:hypothetical protein